MEEEICCDDFDMYPQVLISVAVHKDQKFDGINWLHWLKTIPAPCKYVKVQGKFKSQSTTILFSVPIPVWNLLPSNPTYRIHHVV
jgi:hypothetical protein